MGLKVGAIAFIIMHWFIIQKRRSVLCNKVNIDSVDMPFPLVTVHTLHICSLFNTLFNLS